MNTRTLTILMVHCQTDDQKEDVTECTSRCEALRHIAGLVQSLQKDGYRSAADADTYAVRLTKGAREASIWVTTEEQFVEEYFADDIAENMRGQ